MVKNEAVVPRRLYWLGVAGALICMCIWSGWLVLSRAGLELGISVIDLMFLRYTVAFIAVLPFLWKFWPRHISWKWQVILASTSAGIPYAALSFAGLQTIEIAEAGILQNGFIPVMTAIFLLLLEGKKPGWMAATGMLIILAGSALLAVKDGQLQFSQLSWGHLYMFLTAVIIAFYLVIAPYSGINSFQVMIIVPTYNAIVAIALWLIWGNYDMWQLGLPELIGMGLYQGLGPSLLGVWSFFVALKYFGKPQTACVMAGIPALATAIAIPALGEYPEIWGWLGIILVSVGIILIVRQKN